MALCDVVLLRDLLRRVKNLDDFANVDEALETFHYQRGQHAMTINVLAQALYALYSAGSY